MYSLPLAQPEAVSAQWVEINMPVRTWIFQSYVLKKSPPTSSMVFLVWLPNTTNTPEYIITQPGW